MPEKRRGCGGRWRTLVGSRGLGGTAPWSWKDYFILCSINTSISCHFGGSKNALTHIYTPKMFSTDLDESWEWPLRLPESRNSGKNLKNPISDNKSATCAGVAGSHMVQVPECSCFPVGGPNQDLTGLCHSSISTLIIFDYIKLLVPMQCTRNLGCFSHSTALPSFFFSPVCIFVLFPFHRLWGPLFYDRWISLPIRKNGLSRFLTIFIC